MTWANFTDRGASDISFALVIEGWPDIWVTDDAITLTSDLDGRTVYAGLKRDGIEIQERALPGEGKLEGSAITFNIVSVSEDDEATASFANFQEPIAKLETSLTAIATTLDLVGAASPADGHYHIGTEVIEVSTFPTISRAQWGSYAQIHNVTSLEVPLKSVWLYSSPPALEGRRVTLYAYTSGDTLTALSGGTVVWRGYILNPASIADDGVTWRVQAAHISAVLNQSVAPYEVSAQVQGIYHSRECACTIHGFYNGTGVAAPRYVTGHHQTRELFIADVQTEIDAVMNELVGDTTTHPAYLYYDDTTNSFSVDMQTGSPAPNTYTITVGSPLIGYVEDATVWTERLTGNTVKHDNLGVNTDYTIPLIFYPDWVYAARGTMDGLPEGHSFPSTLLGPSNISSPFSSPLYAATNNLIAFDPDATESEWRVYTGLDLSSLSGADSILIEGTNVPDGLFTLGTAGVTGGNNYFEITAPTRVPWFVDTQLVQHYETARGFIGPETLIRPVVNFGTGDLLEFIDELLDRGGEANDGLLPHIVTDDFTAWASLVLPSSSTSNPVLNSRRFVFADAITLEDIFAAELLLNGLMFYTDSAGKLNFRAFPQLSGTAIATDSITTAEYITPAGGYGAWPRVEYSRDGLVNSVTVQEGYNAVEGDWQGRQFVMKDASSIAEHKNRGRGGREIKPYSQAADEAIDEIIALNIAGRYLNFMSRPYMAVTLQVGYTLLDLRLGDTVNLTCPQVPNGTGSRGFTNKRCFVVERKWNFDPSREFAGELVLWTLIRDQLGYAPSAWVTSQVDSGGDLWAIEALSSNAMNIALSNINDGKVLQHFAVDDLVRIVKVDDVSETIVEGTVTDLLLVSDGIFVQFDATWTPGADDWVLEFRDDDGSATENMRKYCYTADANLLLADGSIAREFG